MASPRITAGERRGLILLIIILIVATALLCWRDHAAGRLSMTQPSGAAVQPLPLPSDTSLHTIPADTSATVKRNGKAGVHPRRQSAPVPVRNPRDERIN